MDIDFDGYAIGGLSVGEPEDEMMKAVEWVTPILPEDKPHYLMGVGSPQDMIKAIANGIDMFDSTYPTSNARHNTLFTFKGKIKIRNSKYKDDFSPIEKGCNCQTCKRYSKSFIHHLMRNHEPLGKILTTHHNLYFMQEMLKRAKAAIRLGEYDKFVKDFTF